MKNFIQPGETMTFTAPAGGVVSGKGYKIGQLFVVAAHSANAGAKFEGQVVGVFDLPKAASQAWTEGALVYWDDTEGECTTTATGNLLIGVAATAVSNDAGNVIGRVRLNGIGRASEASGS
jgi:predicted RecA/RadA family phage recombinase